MSKIIATWFYSGLAPKAPGTWGSLAALPFAFAMYLAGFSMLALLVAVALIFAIGWWATEMETKGKDNHDPGEIVIDEVAGQWLALLPLFLSHVSPTPAQMIFWMLIGFGLFRLFDIFKPFPVKWADQMDTSFGVMFDDILAGLMAAFVLLGAMSLFSGL